MPRKVCLRQRGNGTLTLIANWAINGKLNILLSSRMREEGGESKGIEIPTLDLISHVWECLRRLGAIFNAFRVHFVISSCVSELGNVCKVKVARV